MFARLKPDDYRFEKLNYSKNLVTVTSILMVVGEALWSIKDILTGCPKDMIWLDIILRCIPGFFLIPIFACKDQRKRADFLFAMSWGYIICTFLIFNNLSFPMIGGEGFFIWMLIFKLVDMAVVNSLYVNISYFVFMLLLLVSDATLFPHTILSGGATYYCQSPTLVFGMLVVAFSCLMFARVNNQMFRTIHEQKADIKFASEHDNLSQLYNRRILKGDVKDKHNGILLMIDIDNFKRINDKYGHDEGDNAIRFVAETLTQSFQRSSDYIIRFGGDEFLVLVKAGTDMDAVLNILFRNIKEKNNKEYELTLSCGYSNFESSLCSFDDVLKQADAALYEAKKSGRNQWREYQKEK